MALSIVVEPTKLFVLPAWNKIEYIISSTNTAQPGFKVVCEVIMFGTDTTTFNLEVRPGTTRVYIDVSDVVRTFMTRFYSFPANGFTAGLRTTSLPDLKVTFQEFYSEALQGSVLDTGERIASRSVFDLFKWNTGVFANFQILDAVVADQNNHFWNGFDNEIDVIGITTPVVSGANNFKKIMEFQQEQLRFAPQTNAAGTVTINTLLYAVFYNSSFVQTQKANIDLGAITQDDFYSVDINPSEIDGHTWIGDSMNPTTTDIYMAFWLVDIDVTKALTRAKLFKINHAPCEVFTNYEVHWLNRFGGFDSWRFEAKSMHNTTVVQGTYKNEAVEISGTDILSNNTYQRRIRPFHTQLAEEYLLNSNNLRQWEYEGLRDLLTSPEVYMRIAQSPDEADEANRNYQYFSAVITKNQTVRNFRNEEGGIFNMKVNIKIDTSEQRQW